MPSYIGSPAECAARSLSRKGTPRNGPSGRSSAAAARALSNSGVITALISGSSALDARDRLVDQLGGAGLPAADQLGLIRCVRDRTGHAANLTQVKLLSTGHLGQHEGHLGHVGAPRPANAHPRKART